MKDGQCPKCDSRTIYKSKQMGIIIGGFTVFTGGVLQISGTSYVSYICTTCGYFENYVTDEKRLAEVTTSERWMKV